ncbi:MAG: CoA-binding protein [Theionarchaea archaeon]|nr:CoA-binding protein [Theionarchaea archaeon]MBU7035764.1 CoA-binding protein [Theionarchaea archaeon]
MSLEKFFSPESVAVVGASRTFGKAGNVILLNLLNLGYKGRIYPVNPKADTVFEMKCYPTVSSIPEVVDVAVVATPSTAIPEIMRDIQSKKVTHAVIISSGFSEGNEEGNRLHDEVLAIAQKAHIRIIGPNTTGITSSESRFCTSFVPIEDIPPGDVAFVAQTGLFLGVLLETLLSEEHFGISKVVGLGNKMDVEDSEVMEYLAQDEKTSIICFYIEGLKKAREFYEMAKKAARKKPVLVVKSGVTGEGSRAAISHTASLSGNDQLFSAMCKQAGIIRAADLEELVEAAKAFAFQPLPRGKRTALVHYTGAGCVMGADSIVEHGLEMAHLAEKTLVPLHRITPAWHTLRNPVDLWPSIESAGADKAFSTIVKSLIEDEGVDAVILAVGCMKGFPLEWPDMEEFYGKKPVLIAVEGDRELGFSALKKLEGQKFPCYRSVQRAVRALAHMVEYSSQHR